MYNHFLDGVQFPIAPEEMTTKVNGKNKTITLMNEGEVNQLKKVGLTDIKVQYLLPNVRYPFAVYPSGFRPASFFLEKLDQIMSGQKPVSFIVNRFLPNGTLLFDTNMLVSLEDYEILENTDNGFDQVVSLQLKQYRHYGTKKIEIKQQPTTTSTPTKQATVTKQRDTSTKVTPKTHTVVSGDTLWVIAKKHLGDGSKYPELAAKNNIKNANLIRVGQVIKL